MVRVPLICKVEPNELVLYELPSLAKPFWETLADWN